MSKGIYLFWDNKYEQVIYAGRFTGRKRIEVHFHPSQKHKQKINAYVQNHPDRIESVIFCEFDDISNDDLNQLEKETIKLFKLNKYKHPDSFVFNFTDGGDGSSGYITSKETKKKISESHIGKTISEETKKKMSEAHIGKILPKETKKKMSENNARYWEGQNLSEEHKKKISESHIGKTHSEETKKKISESQSGENNPNWKNYPRITKAGKNKKERQQYAITYNNKRFATSLYKEKLYEKWYDKYPNIELVDETI